MPRKCLQCEVAIEPGVTDKRKCTAGLNKEKLCCNCAKSRGWNGFHQLACLRCRSLKSEQRGQEQTLDQDQTQEQGQTLDQEQEGRGRLEGEGKEQDCQVFPEECHRQVGGGDSQGEPAASRGVVRNEEGRGADEEQGEHGQGAPGEGPVSTRAAASPDRIEGTPPTRSRRSSGVSSSAEKSTGRAKKSPATPGLSPDGGLDEIRQGLAKAELKEKEVEEVIEKMKSLGVRGKKDIKFVRELIDIKTLDLTEMSKLRVEKYLKRFARKKKPASPGEEESLFRRSLKQFDVHLNVQSCMFSSRMAEDFPGWNLQEEKSIEDRQRTSVNELYERLKSCDDNLEVLGFNEFPYTCGGSLKREEWRIEREVWFLLRATSEGVPPTYIVFHLLFAGMWRESREERDCSVVGKVRMRSSTKVRSKKHYVKCTDTTKWDSAGGGLDLRSSSMARWRWREGAEGEESMAKVRGWLVRAEQEAPFAQAVTVGPCWNLAGTRRRAALIVCNQAYRRARCFPELYNPVPDGRQLGEVLEELGWKVEFRVDLNLEELVGAVRCFRDAIGDNESAAMLAFVGHGVEVHGKLFLLPTDIQLEVDNYFQREKDLAADLARCSLSFDAVQSELRGRNGTCPTLFVLDCCRSSNNSRSPIFQPSTTVQNLELKNSCIIYSTQSGQVALEGAPGDGGPFMSAFAGELRKEEAELNQVLIETRKIVMNSTGGAQMAPNQSLLLEQFFFCPPEIAACL